MTSNETHLAVMRRWHDLLTRSLAPLHRDIAARVALSFLACGFIELAIELATSVELEQFEELKRRDFAGYALGAIVFAPPIENLIVVSLIALLLKVTSPVAAALVTAIVLAAAHAPSSGLAVAFVVFPAFVIYAATYLAYRPSGWWKAYLMSVLIHAMDNAIVVASNLSEHVFG